MFVPGFRSLLFCSLSALLGSPAMAADLAYPNSEYGIGGSDPRGVSAGQFNSGSITDLVVADAGTNTVSILLGQGGGVFGDPTDFTTGAEPRAVRAIDIDSDGRADVVTANRVGNSVSVLLGDGSGGLDPKHDFATNAAPSALAVVDWNGDGDLDVATASPGVISILLGNGDGTLRTKQTVTVTGTVDLAAVDLNQDGKPDLVTANGAANSITVRLNTTPSGGSTMSFSAAINSSTGSNPRMVAGADLNADGKPDLVTINQGDGSCTLLRNTTAAGGGTPSFVAWPTFLTGAADAPALALADLDLDGKQDLVVVDDATSALLLAAGNGAGGFGAVRSFVTDTWPTTVVVAALDQDGVPDLVTSNLVSSDISVLLARYLIHASASAGGTIDPSGDVEVVPGADATFAFAANDWECSTLADVLVDGASVGTPPSFTFTHVATSHTIDAVFTTDSGTHTITAIADWGGSITPSGSIPVTCYDYTSITITPDPSFAIRDVTIDGISQGPIGYYLFQHVTSDHTIHATFQRFATYDVFDLGPVGSSQSVAYDLSENGEVTGYARDASNHLVPILYADGGSTLLPGLGGTVAGGRGVDALGHVCGGSYLPGGTTLEPFYWNGNSTTQLALLSGGTTGEATDMNENGRAVGYSNNTAGASRAVYWDQGGAPHDIGLLPNGYAAKAVAVNSLGWILGQCTVFNTNEGSDHVFVWRDGVFQDYTQGEYGTHIPLGWNDAGRIVGYDQGFSGGLFYKFPFVIEANGTRQGLPLLSGYPCGWATDVNNDEVTVGYSGWPWSGSNEAVIYQGGEIRSLNSLLVPGSGWFLTRAYAINNTGEIVGEGIFGGATHAFLLRPQQATAVESAEQIQRVGIRSLWPNPSHGRVNVRFELPAATPATLGIYDVSGRELRSFAIDAGNASRELSWDGDDAAGRPAPAGIYWMRLTAPTGRQARSIVLLR